MSNVANGMAGGSQKHIHGALLNKYIHAAHAAGPRKHIIYNRKLFKIAFSALFEPALFMHCTRYEPREKSDK